MLFPDEEARVEEVLGRQGITVRVHDEGEEAHRAVAGLVVPPVEDPVKPQHLLCLPFFAVDYVRYLW